MMLQEIVKIIVHGGIFHADDVCTVAWLRMLGVNVPVERRNPTPEELSDPYTLVADVGRQHAPILSNYDHHQVGAGVRWDTNIPYAAFGLIYDQYQPVNPQVAQRFHDRVVLPLDAADTGYKPELWAKVLVNNGGDVEEVTDAVWGEQPYKDEWYLVPVPVRPAQFSFSAAVAGFNPGSSVTAAERDAAFEKAVAFSRQVLENELRNAEEFVAAKEAVLAAHTADANRVLLLEKYVPWDTHIFTRPDQERLLYVVFPSERGGWLCQQVPKEAGSFAGRKPLPEAWAGRSGEEFATLVGLSAHGDATFCHQGRFIAGGQTREDALLLAAKAVEA